MKSKSIFIFLVLILISISVGFIIQDDIIENPDKYTEVPTLYEALYLFIIISIVCFGSAIIINIL